MSNSTKVKARRDLIKYKFALRQRSRDRDQRIEAAALDVLVQLGKRADAERAAGHALELLHAEGLKAADVAGWCGGLTAAEINRLRAVARTTDTDADSPVGGAGADADRAAHGTGQ
jgi:hypothetical protein